MSEDLLYKDGFCIPGLAPAQRCGFNIGKAMTDPCSLMTRRVGLKGMQHDWYIRCAKLPSVEKWFSRNVQCGQRAVDKKWCSSASTAWVWECYAVKYEFDYWNEWADAKGSAPYMENVAVGAEGISFIENGKDHESSVCFKYKDFKPQRAYQRPNIFAKNQWTRLQRSRDANAAIGDEVYTSNSYVPILDSEGLGVICAWDEVYIHAGWFSTASINNEAGFFIELLFRPRQISRIDLMMAMIKQRCHARCDAENVINFPCPSKCHFDPDADKYLLYRFGENEEISKEQWEKNVYPGGLSFPVYIDQFDKTKLIPLRPDNPDPKPPEPEPKPKPDPPPQTTCIVSFSKDQVFALYDSYKGLFFGKENKSQKGVDAFFHWSNQMIERFTDEIKPGMVPRRLLDQVTFIANQFPGWYELNEGGFNNADSIEVCYLMIYLYQMVLAPSLIAGILKVNPEFALLALTEKSIPEKNIDVNLVHELVKFTQYTSTILKDTKPFMSLQNMNDGGNPSPTGPNSGQSTEVDYDEEMPMESQLRAEPTDPTADAEPRQEEDGGEKTTDEK